MCHPGCQLSDPRQLFGFQNLSLGVDEFLATTLQPLFQLHDPDARLNPST
jgi:hypothetical protein